MNGPKRTTVVIVDVDGATTLDVWDGDPFPQIRASVGGDAVPVRVAEAVTMWLNEDGMATQPGNPQLTVYAAAQFGTQQPFHGTAVFTGSTPAGAITGLPSVWQHHILTGLRGCEECGAPPGQSCSPTCTGHAAFLDDIQSAQ